MSTEKEEKRAAKQIEEHMGYKPHQCPKQCCGNCGHSHVTNPGANSPGLGCKIMDMMGKQAGYEYAHCQVDDEAVCKFYK